MEASDIRVEKVTLAPNDASVTYLHRRIYKKDATNHTLLLGFALEGNHIF